MGLWNTLSRPVITKMTAWEPAPVTGAGVPEVCRARQHLQERSSCEAKKRNPSLLQDVSQKPLRKETTIPFFVAPGGWSPNSYLPVRFV